MDLNTDQQQDAAAATPPADAGAAAEQAAAPKSGKKAAQAANQPPAAATPPAAIPEQVELAAPHGFIDGTGTHRFWPAGTIVKAEDEIKLLLSRLAPLVGIDYKD